MVLQRLDSLVVLSITSEGKTRRGGGATGYIKEAYIAHLLPPSEFNPNHAYYWTVSPAMTIETLSEQDFFGLVEGLEEEFSREYVAQQVEGETERSRVC